MTTPEYVPQIIEAKIDGKWIQYDAACSWDLKEAKAYHRHFSYIGSGMEYRVNGIEHKSKELIHFFTRK